MWCATCRQDVPGLTSTEPGRYLCPRCGAVVCDQIQTASPPAAPSAEASERVPDYPLQPMDALGGDLAVPPPLDTWELDERLRRVSRLLGLYARQGPDARQTRFDPAQPAASGWHRREQARSRSDTGPNLFWRLAGVLSTTFTWLGTTALTCGGVLIAWANLGARHALQIVGWPIAVGGAVAMLVGLVIYLDQDQLGPQTAATSASRRIDRHPARAGNGPHPRRPAKHRAGRAA